MDDSNKQISLSSKQAIISQDEKVLLNIPSDQWIKKFGLKKQRLELKQILSKVGFRNCDDYIQILKKPVTSKYSDGLFKKVSHTDGVFYNVTASDEKLIHIEGKLKQTIDLYKSRLEWLNTGSRRVFGVIEEKNTCMICDIQQDSPKAFVSYNEIIQSVIRDQLKYTQTLITVRAAPEMQKWVSSPRFSDEENIKRALSWWEVQSSSTEYSITCVLEAIMDVANDEKLEAIYLVTDGSCLKGGKDILLEKVKTLTKPINVVFIQEYEISEEDEAFLKSLTSQSGGRLHTFNLNGDSENSSLSQKDRNIRPEVMLVWEELDKARNILYEVKKLMTEMQKEKHSKSAGHPLNLPSDEKPPLAKTEKPNELNMTSKEWLKIHSLRKTRLTIETFLRESVFNHCDGVLSKPRDRAEDDVLVNARYCQKFAHLEWKDGTVKHVHVTESVYRKYREKLLHVLETYKKRLHWLQRGSRELFGTVVESKVLVLIDTSASMAIKIDTVKRKLLKLCKEQLANKSKFNIISFNSKVTSWRENLVNCSFDNLENALQWVDDLNVQGSTNTFGALGLAYQMTGVEGIYLLSDGRPDQPTDMILAQVEEGIPIHTISFNCTDPEANQFLYELAHKTKGRYHCYSEIVTTDKSMPPTYESEDLMLIRREIECGIRDMEAMLQLRNECLNKDLIFKQERDIKSESRLSSKSARQRPYSAIGYNDTRSSLLRSDHITCKKLTEEQKNVEKNDGGDEKSKNKHKKKKKKRKKIKESDDDSEIKKWLRENSLHAQRLTILDALKPTIIQQKATYVSSLGKEVLSKVYGEIFPIIHTSSGKTKEFQIVNPQAVDLISYEKKLQNALDAIEAKLDEFILDNLSDEARDRLSVDGEPIRYCDMKDDILKDLDHEDVDASVMKDVKLLEKELEQGETYMKQSKDLRATVDHLSKEAKQEKARESEQKDKTTKSANTANKSHVNPKFRYHRVLARSDLDGFYYPAIVNKYINARFVRVLFDDGELQLTCVRFLIPIGGSAPCPALNIGDYVLVKCYSQQQDYEEMIKPYYVPGIVQVSPLKMKATDNFYTVVKYNTKKCTVQRKDLVKITRSRFVFSMKFIQELQQNIASFDTKRFQTLQSLHVPRPPSSRSSTSSRSSLKTTSHNGSRPHSRTSSNHSHQRRRSSNNDVIGSENEAEDENMEEVKGDHEEEGEDGDEQNKPEEGREIIIQEIEKLKNEKQILMEEIQKRLEEDHASKLKEIEEQKTTLMQFHDKLALNESKLSEQQVELEKLRHDLTKEREDFLEKKLNQKNEEKEQWKDEYKDIQLELFKRLQEQQEQFLTKMFELNPPSPSKNTQDQTTFTEDETEQDEKPGNETAGYDKEKEEDEENDENVDIKENRKDEDDITVLVSPISDAVLLAQGDSGVFVSRSPLDIDPSVETKPLPSIIKPNEEVLSRFMDDGWYYRGIVKKMCTEDGRYLIEDGVGDVEEVGRNDVITDDDDASIVIRVSDYVVALHPCYLYAYAPGCVITEEPDASYRVQFYDGQISVVPRSESYFIGPDKFQRDVSYIRARENALIGQAVVCRSNKNGGYHLGVVRDRVGGCRNYLVEWADQSLDVQNYAYIFGAHTKRHKFVEGSKILAICNVEKYDYFPGTVNNCDGNLLEVEFIDGKKIQDIDANQAFWLSEDYFRMAYQFWKEKDGKRTEVTLDT